ncbi:MAG TPA: ABC transporter ATP-binding protein [Treponemataceae bacterium]|nr:ABC transporter ATP-binding protein [Treponemataceae bacterium]
MDKKYIRASIFAPIAMVFEVFLQTLIPVLMARIIDVGIVNSDISYTVRVGIQMVVIALVSMLVGALSARWSSVGALGFAKNIRQRMFNNVQDFSFKNTNKFGTASLVTRLTTDVTNTQNMYLMTLRVAVRAPVMLIMAVSMCFYINKNLSTVFLFIIPILVLVIAVIAKKAFPLFEKMLKQYDALNGIVRENLTAIRTIKAFVREDYENEKFHKAADEVRKAQFNAENLIIKAFPIATFLLYATIIVIQLRGGIMIINGTLLTGELISLITYAGQVLFAILMLAMIFVTFVISQASIKRIVAVLDEKPSIITLASKTNDIYTVHSGTVEFKNVFFSYTEDTNNCVLKDINLKIKKGQTVGIIGGTGSSKTTLVQLIPRLYDVISGTVFIDGIDVRYYELEELRKNVSMVLQNNVLFSGTIAENLKWGNEDASDEDLIEACTVADAHSFITGFSDGYQTMLGQGGVNVSGGQKQRLCIARALLAKPKVLIFDDSTSAVDTATDSRIRAGLKKSLPDTTKIIIAQRINSVQDADQIFVIDDGQIVDVGTHDELVYTSTIYGEVYEQQCAGMDSTPCISQTKEVN